MSLKDRKLGVELYKLLGSGCMIIMLMNDINVTVTVA